jgi:hypothetical protein
MLAFAAVLFSQSRAGMVFLVIAVVVLLFAKRRLFETRPRVEFILAFVAVIVGTIYFSPVLNGNWTIEQQANLGEESGAYLHQNPMATLDRPVSLSERLKARLSGDTALYRLGAVPFYARLAKEYPLGLGTGFTNKFLTGPHNTWLKLAVDEGIFAAFLLAVMLGSVGLTAIRTRSPYLISAGLIALIDTFFDQTFVVNPTIPIALAIGMGMITGSARSTRTDWSEHAPPIDAT